MSLLSFLLLIFITEDFKMADWTRLELATPGVTGQYSNQLNYQSTLILLLLNKSIQILRHNYS